jgi:pyroglutamyl-peptidase
MLANSAVADEHRRFIDVQTSEDVGNFVCGFEYYVSLLEMQKRGKQGDVVFLHVPVIEGEAAIMEAVKCVEVLIQSLVEVRAEK